MAQIRTRLSVKDYPIPLISDDLGNTSFVASYDQANAQPLPYWVENVMPTKTGLKAVAIFDKLSTPFPSKYIPFKPTKLYTKLIFSPLGDSALVMQYDDSLLVLTSRLSQWTELAPAVSLTGQEAQIVNVQGVHYVFHKALGLKKFNETLDALEPVTLNGLEQPQVDGIASINNYLVVWINNAVYWSTPTNPEEFNPLIADITTGAGSSFIQGIKGVIIGSAVVNTALIFFTNFHAISMRFTGSTANPWVFKEVLNSFGVNTPRHITSNNSGVIYVWSSAGLQAVNETEATNIFPEVTDFIKGGVYEYREECKYFEISKKANKNFNIRLAFVSGRFLCISYGIEAYEFSLVYDIGLKRWGKLSFKHYEMIEDVLLISGVMRIRDLVNPIKAYAATPIKALEGDYYNYLQVPNTFCYIAPDGTIKQVSTSDRNKSNIESIILYGKLSNTRTFMSTLVELWFSKFDYKDGKIIVRTEFDNQNIYTDTELVRDEVKEDCFIINQEGRDHLICVYGTFTITNLEVTLVKSSRM